MSENNQEQEHNQDNTPFFERYLEGQESEEVSEELSEEESDSISGGLKFVTQAYPSDREGYKPIYLTKRYPSDRE